MVHMTGDAVASSDGPLRPPGIYLNEVQGFMSPEDQAAVRALALEVITRLPRRRLRAAAAARRRDRARDDELPRRRARCPTEYVPMMLEELELDGATPATSAGATRIADEAKAGFHVVVIGAGMSGLLAGIRLGQAGIPYTIIEKNAGVGGTWFENRYPGCRVDVGNHFYCYSFAPDDDWTEFFAQQPELQAYFERCMRRLRRRRPHPLRHRGRRRPAGTRRRHAGRSRSATPTGRTDDARGQRA